jgi:hypothetical protein
VTTSHRLGLQKRIVTLVEPGGPNHGVLVSSLLVVVSNKLLVTSDSDSDS